MRITVSIHSSLLAAAVVLLVSPVATAQQPVLPGSVLNADGSYTYIFRPSAGANNGTDQGGLTSGKDAGAVLQNGIGTFLTPASAVIGIFNSNCNAYDTQAYFQWDVSDLPASVTRVRFVTHHRIISVYTPYQVNPTTMIARTPMVPWEEHTLTWNTRPPVAPAIWGSVNITTPGVVGVAYDGPAYMDLTELYRAWKDGTLPNYGIEYSRSQRFCENGNANNVDTSDSVPGAGGIDRRPYLEITYAAESPGEACQEDLVALQGQLAGQQVEIDALEAVVAACASERDSLANANAALTTQTTSLSAELSALGALNQQLATEVGALQAANAGLAAQVAALEAHGRRAVGVAGYPSVAECRPCLRHRSH